MRDKLLKLLQENRDKYISGELISDKFNVSRTAIWKQINALRKNGYEIESATNRGYKLIKETANITPEGIFTKLASKKLGTDIICLDEVGSTNDYAKVLAAQGQKDGTLIVAEQQNNGRGRLGRKWCASKGSGIWMSLIFRPDIQPQKAQIVTLAVAVAVVQALRPILGERVKVKWPNDVLVDDRKLCGILTEMNCELENINYLVVGIGINVNQLEADFPEELKKTATSVRMVLNSSECFDRVSIITEILKYLEELYLLILEGKTDKVVDNWRLFSATLGRKVKVKSLDTDLCGVAVDITKDGVLLLKDDSGEIHRIFSGEIFI